MGDRGVYEAKVRLSFYQICKSRVHYKLSVLNYNISYKIDREILEYKVLWMKKINC